MNSQIEQSQFNLVALFDRFAALGRAMQKGTQAATMLEVSKENGGEPTTKNFSSTGVTNYPHL